MAQRCILPAMVAASAINSLGQRQERCGNHDVGRTIYAHLMEAMALKNMHCVLRVARCRHEIYTPLQRELGWREKTGTQFARYKM